MAGKTIIKTLSFFHSLEHHAYHHAWRARGFYEYYRIVRGDETDETKRSEPKKKSEELKTVGLHSLWGTIITAQKETGCSWDEILYKRSWINIRMMLADAPRVQRSNGKKKQKLKGFDELPNTKQ